MRILQCGVAYSPNVGDGLIAACMAHAVERLLPGAEFRSLDIAGREGFAEEDRRAGGPFGRATLLRLLSALPPSLRRFAVRRHLSAKLSALEPGWRRALEEADAVILGGGQILADADLNFPLKIGRLARLAAEAKGGAGLPLAIHAAGVTGGWSGEGRTLFALLADTRLAAIGLRDAGSVEHWRDQADFGPAPMLTRDTGLLTAAAFPRPRGGDRRAGPVGLGIADPALLSYHAEGGVAGAGIDFQVALAATLAAEGNDVLLFCNGAEEDANALDCVAAHPRLARLVASGRVRAAPRPLVPAALAGIVAGCGGMVAHRLHALIAAYSYGVPAVALGWDRKVASFHEQVGRGAYTLTDGAAAVEDIAATLRRAVADPVPDIERAAAADAALQDMARTLAALGLPVETAPRAGVARGTAA